MKRRKTFDNNWQNWVYNLNLVLDSIISKTMNPMCEDFPEVMNIAEVCRYLRIPRSSLYKLAQEGKIPCQKVGRHWRFHRLAIDRWLARMPAINEMEQNPVYKFQEE